MPRSTFLWTLVVFFGASIAFRAVIRATDGEPLALRLGLQLLVAAVMVAAIVAIVRRQRS